VIRLRFAHRSSSNGGDERRSGRTCGLHRFRNAVIDGHEPRQTDGDRMRRLVRVAVVVRQLDTR
jgi:hypothetical protein